MSSKRNGGYVTKGDCREQVNSIRESVNSLEKEVHTEFGKLTKVLIGEDMQGGLVAKVNSLMKDRSLAMQVLRNIVVPVIAAAISAVLTAYIMNGGHI